MRREDKELLLKDLSARLPYGVKCKVNYIINNETTYGEDVESECIDTIKKISFDTCSVYTELLGYESDIEDIKPYLRPLSSMTEEEEKEYINIDNRSYSCPMVYAHIPASDRIDWLNAHHFDYHGLIERGLALEAPEGMYN